MEEIINTVILNLPVYLLAFVRISSMFLLSPVFGRKNLPPKYKISFSLILTIIIVPVLLNGSGGSEILKIAGSGTGIVFAVNIAKEMALGVILGFVSLIFLHIAATAGQVIDVSMGLGIGSVFDPQTNTQMPLSGAFLNTAIFVYFIIANGHLRLIRILNFTFISAPIGQIKLGSEIFVLMTEQFILTFGLAVSLMLPIIAMTFIIEAGMGILTRAIPQLHAYLVGIPLKIIVGFSVLLFLQPLYINFCDNVFDKLYYASEQVALGMGG